MMNAATPSLLFLSLLLLLKTISAFLPCHRVSFLSLKSASGDNTHEHDGGARPRMHPTVFPAVSSVTKRHIATRLYASNIPSASSEEATEEWHPIDPAYTTPQLLSALWFLISNANDMVKGETATLLFPQMQDKFSPSYLNRLMGHLDSCKDVCDYFGTKTVLVPFAPQGKVLGFTVKSFRNPNESDEYEFDYDPFWDDGEDWDYEGIDAQVEAEKGITSSISTSNLPEIVNRIPDNDEEIVSITKRWVDKMMSDMGICPFTSGPDMAGLPIGPVYYTVDRSTKIEDLYARFWKEVVRVEQNPEKQLSTTLLMAPEFCIDNIELFESFSNTLTQPLTALGVEDLLQLVFFHPQWTFRDGGERSGVGAAANYARRSPWPMINILRTSQVRAAQKGIPTGLVYQQNEKTLNSIGAEQLERMLRLRDWSDIQQVKVNRRDMEALRVAQDFQQTGKVASKDTSFAYDSTPAANRVDRSQIEGGNMVNVLKDALGKRLGKMTGGVPTPLSGPETSATVMASDFLLEELDRIAQKGNDITVSMQGEMFATSKDERMREAKRAILQDLQGDSIEDRDELDVMFGRKGIADGKNDDEEGGSGGSKFGMFY